MKIVILKSYALHIHIIYVCLSSYLSSIVYLCKIRVHFDDKIFPFFNIKIFGFFKHGYFLHFNINHLLYFTLLWFLKILNLNHSFSLYLLIFSINLTLLIMTHYFCDTKFHLSLIFFLLYIYNLLKYLVSIIFYWLQVLFLFLNASRVFL